MQNQDNARREAFEAKRTAEMAKFDAEEIIRAALPDVGCKWSVCVFGGNLKSPVAYAYLAQPYQHNAAAESKPTLETVAQVAELLPPLPLMKIKSGCLSFKIRAEVETLTVEQRDRAESEDIVSPVMVVIDPGPRGHNSSMKVEWFTRIEGAGVVRIHVELPTYQNIESIGALTVKYRDIQGGYVCDACRFAPSPRLIVIRDANDTPVAQLASPIQWAAGGPEYANPFTLYWTPMGDGDMTVADLVRAAQGVKS